MIYQIILKIILVVGRGGGGRRGTSINFITNYDIKDERIETYYSTMIEELP